MRVLIYLFLTSQLLFSAVYYSKVEPYKVKKLSSSVSGEVLFTYENQVGKRLTKKPFIIIDSEIDRAELIDVDKKLKSLRNSLALNEKVLKNLSAVLKKKKANFKRTESLKIKSRIDKDREFYDLIASENAFITTQKELNSLSNSIADLELRRVKLQKSIRDKKVLANGYLLYAINVQEGEVVNIGTPLAQVADISKALLTIYVDDHELENIKNKTIYINDKKTDYKILRILDIADSVNISKYKVQIAIQAPKVFSKLAKVELKEDRDEK